MKKPVKGLAKRSLLTKNKRKRLYAKSEHNTRQPAKFGVYCTVHGRSAKPGNPPYVSVGAPKHKRAGLRGCPACRKSA